MRNGPNFGRLLNIARIGFDTDKGELHDLRNAAVDLALAAIARNRDVVIGVKVRLSANVTGPNDLEALRRAQEVASSFGMPVMVHIGQSYAFQDNYKTIRTGSQRLLPIATVVGGKKAPPRV